MSRRTRIVFLRVSLGIFLLLFVCPASAQDLRTAVEQITSDIARATPGGKQLRVAVADFPDLQGVTSDLGRYVASRLTTRLAQTGKFWVIERQRLGQVLAELKFSMSDLVDPAKAKQLGRMAGVEAIVVGTVSDLGNQVDLDARVIDIETNRMLAAAATTISKDQVVADMLQRGRVAPADFTTSPAQQTGTAVAIPSPGRLDPHIVRTLKDASTLLAESAARGLEWHEREAGNSLVGEYNSLVRRARSSLKADPFVLALEEVTTEHRGDVAAYKVSALSKELELYLTSFESAKALKATATTLAHTGARGLQWHEREAGNMLIAQFNLLLQKSKKLFTGHPILSALEPLKTADRADVAAGRVARLAKELETVLASLEKH